MKYCYITFRSITFAQRAERLLKSKGMRLQLLRTPRALAVRGCGYCLQLRLPAAADAVRALREGELSYGKVFAVLPEGGFEELAI